MAQSFIDEIDCGNLFDPIDDLMKFPADVECGAAAGYMVGSSDSKDITSICSAAFPEADNLYSGSHTDDLLAKLSVPYEDIVQLEWLSTFVEDSFSFGGMTIGKENLLTKKETSPEHFQSCSPVSVLESSSSSSSSLTGGKSIPPLSSNYQRTRSKRPRPPTFNPRAGIQLIETPTSFVAVPSESENFAVEEEMMKANAPESQKKRKLKMTPPPAPKEVQTIKKCLHCEITKTPQWRTGPMGPKTLCNACGVRYKSGRLFPEYRPAASPTFVPSLHSNSHKKVIEMRTKVVDAAATIEKVT